MQNANIWCRLMAKKTACVAPLVPLCVCTLRACDHRTRVYTHTFSRVRTAKVKCRKHFTRHQHTHTQRRCVRVNNKHARTLTHGFTYSADCAVSARLSPTIPLLLPLHHLYAFIIIMGKNGERGTRPKRVDCSRGGLFFSSFVCLLLLRIII